MKLHQSLLLKELKARFPELSSELTAQDGLLCFEVEVFSRYAQRQIDLGAQREAVACFDIAQKFYLHGNARIKDAIDVCFVEPLIFKNSKKTSRRWAWDCFPETLKELHTRFHSQFRA